MLRIILMLMIVSIAFVRCRRKKKVFLLFGKSCYPSLAQSIPCTNTFSRETPVNVRSKAMNVAVENEVNGASRPNDKYDKPSQISRISTVAYNLTSRATVRRYRRRFAEGIADDDERKRLRQRHRSVCLRPAAGTWLDGDSRKWNLRGKIISRSFSIL